MRFQRSLKTPRPLARGYFAPVTDRVNTDRPTFQIGGSTDIFVPDPIHVPEFLKVKARLNPIKRQGEEVFAVVEKQEVGLKPCSVYEGHQDCQYQAMQLVFESFLSGKLSFSHITLSSSDLFRGSQDSRNKCENDKTILFEKSFITQQSSCVLKQTTIDRKLIITPPGKENGQLLWGYGGYYKMGCDLRQIEQMFFTPIGQGAETGIHVTKASSWAAKGILPSVKSDIIFVDTVTDEGMLNLVGDIENGKAVLNLSIGVDETGAVHEQQYRSVSIQQEDALTGFVEVVFLRYQ